MNSFEYVLVTPVRNEEATIRITIESVIHQTVRPSEWVIVSDASTDKTDSIIREYAAQNSFIHFVRLDNRPERSFASVVFVTEIGIKSLKTQKFNFIGLLDADVRFEAGYYEKLMEKFASDPQLGLAGGLVCDVINGRVQKGRQNLNEIAGATQFFRKQCLSSIGGLIAIPEGGWDAITCMCARINGFKTRTFPEIIMEHLKPRNSSFGNPIKGLWQLGIRDYALGYAPLYMLLKCATRVFDRPILIGSLLRCAGFVVCHMLQRKRVLPLELQQRMRQSQRQHLLRIFQLSHKHNTASQ